MEGEVSTHDIGTWIFINFYVAFYMHKYLMSVSIVTFTNHFLLKRFNTILELNKDIVQKRTDFKTQRKLVSRRCVRW